MNRILNLVTEELKTALLEGARIVVLSIIPIVLMGLNLETGEFSINYSLVIVTAVVTFLRFVDKWLHEVGKKIEDERLVRGLTQF